MPPDNPIRQLFDTHWDGIIAKHGGKFRPIVIESIEKMLWCSTSVYGSKLYICENPQCTHAKYIHHSCKGRACSPCGTKATECWISKQQHILPQCSWQHITFTLPEQFWPLFAANRQLLNSLSKLASKIVLRWAEKKGIEIGVFSALHTYGRQFNWNVHMHLSVTAGGLCKKSGQWKAIYFKADVLRARWREAVIAFFRKQHGRISLPEKFNHPLDWYNFLNGQYHRYWHIHLAKKSKHAKQTVNYLGRYLKKLPLSASRLRHMAANEKLNVRYLDHRTQSHKTLTIDAETLILLLIEHIPDKYFKMIRYYGFLANRKRNLLLPKVYAALDQKVGPAPKGLSFAALLKGYVGVDPFQCILCGKRMIYSSFRHGSSIKKLIALRIQKKM